VVVGASALVSSQTDIAITDFEAYLAYFHLPVPTLQQIPNPNFPDPGLTGALREAAGDLQTIAGVARNATIIYVYSGDAYDALTYAVDQNLAPVITASYNLGCDATNAPALMLRYQGVAQQGNAQGITWVNSSGDHGVAGCDANGIGLAAHGLATRFPGDIPEVTAVGGTEFNEGTGSYWSQTNDANGASALSYIPEIAWNDAPWASGGGAGTFFAKPSWQTGPGVPSGWCAGRSGRGFDGLFLARRLPSNIYWGRGRRWRNISLGACVCRDDGAVESLLACQWRPKPTGTG
jgi:subtilase family serine protease